MQMIKRFLLVAMVCTMLVCMTGGADSYVGVDVAGTAVSQAA